MGQRKASPYLNRLLGLALISSSLLVGNSALTTLTPSSAQAQSSDSTFDLDNIKRMMEDIKRKADEARLGSDRQVDGRVPDPLKDDKVAAPSSEGAPSPENAEAPSDRGSQSVTNSNPVPASPPPAVPKAAGTRAVTEKAPERGGSDRNKAAAPAVGASPQGPDASGFVLRNKTDDRPVDPVKAAAREDEADAVLDAIRRAREARDAWLDDNPDTVLDTLPKTPPSRRFAEPSREDPRIEPAVPANETKRAAIRKDDFDLDGKQGLGGPEGRELLPFEDDGGDLRSERPLRKLAKPTRRVTVLLVMDVGKTGVRRWSKTADPMLCVQEYCFLSRGPSKSAVRHRRQVAFGPSIALGKRGLACRSSPACIFRNVDLGAIEARLQPIDLRFLRHDRREAELVKADTTCAMDRGKLVCGQPVTGKSWRAWIVPELTAELAGQAALKRALAEGLGGTQPLTATSGQKRYRNR
ncbi:MAG: hypothetical protein AAFV69_05470 [Pseudomonadota bacterium]